LPDQDIFARPVKDHSRAFFCLQ